MDNPDYKLLGTEELNYIFQNINAPPEEMMTIPDSYDTIPSDEIFPGDYNFEVFIPAAKNFVYSMKLNKLYVKMLSDFMVQYKWDFKEVSDLYVRIKPRFTNHEDANKPVIRCLQHLATDEDPLYPSRKYHIIQCVSTQADYHGGFTEHLSVICPLQGPEVGSDVVNQTYKFLCQSSCSSGMNRRPIELIFTLEDRNGTVLGRSAINVRVCCCPKRDREKDEMENKSEPKGKKRKMTPKVEPQSFSPPHLQSQMPQVDQLPQMQPYQMPQHVIPEMSRANDSMENINVNVAGLDNKIEILKFIYNLHAGNIVAGRGDSANCYQVLNEVSRMMQGSLIKNPSLRGG